MVSTTGKSLSQWSYTVEVEFVPLPPEKEEAYWAAIEYFREILIKELTVPAAELETVNQQEATARFMHSE